MNTNKENDNKNESLETERPSLNLKKQVDEVKVTSTDSEEKQVKINYTLTNKQVNTFVPCCKMLVNEVKQSVNEKKIQTTASVEDATNVTTQHKNDVIVTAIKKENEESNNNIVERETKDKTLQTSETSTVDPEVCNIEKKETVVEQKTITTEKNVAEEPNNNTSEEICNSETNITEKTKINNFQEDASKLEKNVIEKKTTEELKEIVTEEKIEQEVVTENNLVDQLKEEEEVQVDNKDIDSEQVEENVEVVEGEEYENNDELYENNDELNDVIWTHEIAILKDGKPTGTWLRCTILGDSKNKIFIFCYYIVSFCPSFKSLFSQGN